MVVPETIWDGPVFRPLVTGWIPLVSCTLVRRSALVEVGGLDESLKASEDRDLWLRLAQRTDRREALEDLWWSVLSSREFTYNH